MKHNDTGEHVKSTPMHAHQGHKHEHGADCDHGEAKAEDSFSNELTSEDRQYLVGILTERLGTQREGIYHSDTAKFKDEMKEEEKAIRSLIDKLKVGVNFPAVNVS